MKAEDLMVGDWVLLFDNKFVKVDCIGNTEVYLSDEDGLDWQVSYEYIKPIPLTADILQDNGFTDCETTDFDKENDNWYWYLGEDGYIADDDLMINLMKNSFLVRDAYGSAYGLRYVHELQHALRLFGNEQKIIL